MGGVYLIYSASGCTGTIEIIKGDINLSRNKNGIVRGLKFISSSEAWKNTENNKYKLKTDKYDFLR